MSEKQDQAEEGEVRDKNGYDGSQGSSEKI
jgi:hypothetical protein